MKLFAFLLTAAAVAVTSAQSTSSSTMWSTLTPSPTWTPTTFSSVVPSVTPVVVGGMTTMSPDLSPTVVSTVTPVLTNTWVSVTMAPPASQLGAGCATTAGGSISIINPYSGETLQPGETFQITWDSNGIDATFQNATLAFSIVNDADANNAQPLEELAFAHGAPRVNNGTTTSTIPSNVAAGTSYAVRSEYRDGNIWRYCFSPKFAIGGPVASSGSVVAPPGPTSNTTHTSTTTSGAVKNVLGSLGLLSLAALLV